MDVEFIVRDIPLLPLLGKDVLNLALSSKAIFALACPHINRTLLFRYPAELTMYKPHRLRVGGYHGTKDSEYLYFPVTESRISFYFQLLPSTLTHLTFGHNFGLPLNNHLLALPLTFLDLGFAFNHPVDNNLPSTLTHLIFSQNFNHPVDHLPSSLIHLTFSERFNRPVDHLPPTLVKLKFGFDFNQPVNALPPTLKILKFGLEFDHPVDNLPLLTYLSFGRGFSRSIAKIPNSITHLRLDRGNYKKYNDIDHLPPKLVALDTERMISNDIHLPSSLTSLTTGKFWSKYPPNLKSLTVFKEDEGELGDILLPPSLEKLSLFLNNEKVISAPLPPNLTDLVLSHCYHSNPLQFPSSLQALECTITDKLSSDQIQFIFSLPNLTLLDLHLDSVHSEVLSLKSLRLPPKLTSLNLHEDIRERCPSFQEFEKLVDFKSAPLVDVTITGAAFIPDLPSTVKELSLRTSEWHDFPPNLPPLEILLVHTSFCKSPHFVSIPFLPHLRELLVQVLTPNTLECPHLPESLIVLDVPPLVISPSTQLPPRLIELYATAASRESLPLLPLTLEIIEIDYSK